MDLSYLFNYMEKLLICLMLGCLFWDFDIKVDVRKYFGEVIIRLGGGDIIFDMCNNMVVWFVGNR